MASALGQLATTWRLMLSKPWLGNLALIELKNANGPSFRLCGTNLHGRFGGEGNGCQIEALKDGIAASLHNAARRLPETVEPIQTKHKAEKQRTDRLPDDGVDMDTILFASCAEQD